MRAIITPADLQRGGLMEPGWYPAKISLYEEAVVKGSADKPSDGSTNAIFTFEVLDGPAKGNTLKRYFNEKAMYFAKTLFSILGLPKTPEGGFDITTQLLEQTVNHKVSIYVKRGRNQTNGQGVNEVADFRPLL